MIAIIRDGRYKFIPARRQCDDVYFYDYRAGFRMIEPKHWELVVIDECIMSLDMNWIMSIETHSRKWISI